MIYWMVMIYELKWCCIRSNVRYSSERKKRSCVPHFFISINGKFVDLEYPFLMLRRRKILNNIMEVECENATSITTWLCQLKSNFFSIYKRTNVRCTVALMKGRNWKELTMRAV